jgi:hypothetical protein
MNSWTDHGEDDARAHFTKVYGTPPYNGFRYSIALPGVYPTGNPCESYNKQVKGGENQKGVIETNVSLVSFHTNELGKLMVHLATVAA